jgi:flavin-dependent dehydrogenase
MAKVAIIGGGLAGLECARTLNEQNYDFLLLEKNPSVVKNNSWKTFEEPVKYFGLEDCVVNKPSMIKFRTIYQGKVTYTANEPINCAVIDSKKVYEHYLKMIDASKIITDAEIVGIRKAGKGYELYTKDKAFFIEKIVDASGSAPIVDKLLGSIEEMPTVFYTCYGKRFTNVKTKEIINNAFFDFESPFKLAGSWVYAIDENTADLGVARFSNVFELKNPLNSQRIPELEKLINYYIGIEPFNEAFKNAKETETISGVTPLWPRTHISRNNNTLLYIGDAQGSINYSGYGFENALMSGRKAAESIINNKEYNFHITPPSIGLCILRHLWGCSPEELRSTATGISELKPFEIEKFFRGKTDLQFLSRAYRISRKRNINILKNNPPELLIRALLHMNPLIKYADIFKKPIFEEKRFE